MIYETALMIRLFDGIAVVVKAAFGMFNKTLILLNTQIFVPYVLITLNFLIKYCEDNLVFMIWQRQFFCFFVYNYYIFFSFIIE